MNTIPADKLTHKILMMLRRSEKLKGMAIKENSSNIYISCIKGEIRAFNDMLEVIKEMENDQSD